MLFIQGLDPWIHEVRYLRNTELRAGLEDEWDKGD